MKAKHLLIVAVIVSAVFVFRELREQYEQFPPSSASLNLSTPEATLQTFMDALRRKSTREMEACWVEKIGFYIGEGYPTGKAVWLSTPKAAYILAAPSNYLIERKTTYASEVEGRAWDAQVRYHLVAVRNPMPGDVELTIRKESSNWDRFVIRKVGDHWKMVHWAYIIEPK